MIVLQILHNRNSRGEDYWKIIDSALDEQTEGFSVQGRSKNSECQLLVAVGSYTDIK